MNGFLGPNQATQLEALGFGSYARAWIGTMYNPDAPPLRRVRSNGQRSETFSIYSGVPQGCPASPLIFLLVTEALTRLVLDDTTRIEQCAAGMVDRRGWWRECDGDR